MAARGLLFARIGGALWWRSQAKLQPSYARQEPQSKRQLSLRMLRMLESMRGNEVVFMSFEPEQSEPAVSSSKHHLLIKSLNARASNVAPSL